MSRPSGHRLARAAALPSVALGVIPFAAPERPAWPVEQFTLFDDERVHVELLSAHVTVTAPSEITLYVRAFERLARLSVYGDAAQALIADAIRLNDVIDVPEHDFARQVAVIRQCWTLSRKYGRPP
jgi:hypothetical protein